MTALLTLHDVARLTRTSLKTVRRKAYDGQVPVQIKVFGSWRVDPLVFDKYLKNGLIIPECDCRKKKCEIVYMVYNGSFYKIGITSDLKRRLSELQVASTNDIRLIGDYEIKNSQRVETYLHNKYSKYRVRGEWFVLEPGQVNKIKSHLARLEKKQGHE